MGCWSLLGLAPNCRAASDQLPSRTITLLDRGDWSIRRRNFVSAVQSPTVTLEEGVPGTATVLPHKGAQGSRDTDRPSLTPS